MPQPAGGSDRNAIPLYDFPNQKVMKHYVPEPPLRTSALRTLGGYANVFALESFIDELAAAAGADPVEFRLRHLRDPRARAVIEAAAQRAGWHANAKGRRRARARHRVLQVQEPRAATAPWSPTSKSIPRAARCASRARCRRSTPGRSSIRTACVNQIEGGIIQSTSWTLKESVRFDRTRVTTRSWADYPILQLRRRARGRGGSAQPARRAFPRRGRGLAGPDRRGDRQRDRPRHGQAPARAAFHRASG